LAQLASHRGHGPDTAAISGVTTCCVSAMQASPAIQEVMTELDSHADTCVVGDDTDLTIQDFDRQVKVYGFDSSLNLQIQRLSQVWLAMWIQRQGASLC